VWVLTAAWCGVDIDEFLTVKAWREGIHQRPAVKRGLKVPVTYPFSDDRFLDPKRKEWFAMIEKHGKGVVKNDLQKLTKSLEKL
jgi:hypothetical protein